MVGSCASVEKQLNYLGKLLYLRAIELMMDEAVTKKVMPSRIMILWFDDGPWKVGIFKAGVYRTLSYRTIWPNNVSKVVTGLSQRKERSCHFSWPAADLLVQFNLREQSFNSMEVVRSSWLGCLLHTAKMLQLRMKPRSKRQRQCSRPWGTKEGKSWFFPNWQSHTHTSKHGCTHTPSDQYHLQIAKERIYRKVSYHHHNKLLIVAVTIFYLNSKIPHLMNVSSQTPT